MKRYSFPAFPPFKFNLTRQRVELSHISSCVQCALGTYIIPVHHSHFCNINHKFRGLFECSDPQGDKIKTCADIFTWIHLCLPVWPLTCLLPMKYRPVAVLDTLSISFEFTKSVVSHSRDQTKDIASALQFYKFSL